MPTIVNLSAIHTVNIDEGVAAFTRLRNQYYTGCSSCWPSIFTSMTSKTWVKLKFAYHADRTITPYKLGKISSKEFLRRALEVYDFLQDVDFPESVKNELNADKRYYLALKDRAENDIPDNIIAMTLLEKAWNAIISFTDDDADKLRYLLENSAGDAIYFISNSNELNIHKIIQLIKEKFPGLKLNENIDISVTPDENPIQLAPNIFLCVSYRFGAFKSSSDNEALNNTTPGVLRRLYAHLTLGLRHSVSEIRIISQYEKDLQEAKKLGIPGENIRLAKDYFPQVAQPQTVRGYQSIA